MKTFLLLLASALPLLAQAPPYQLPVTVVTQKWFGNGPPSGANVPGGNQPGDTYHDNKNDLDYRCTANWPTPAPACIAVAVGQWVSASAGGSPITGATTGAIVTPAGPTGPLQTPSANATVDSGGNVGGTSFNAVADGVHAGYDSFVGNTTAPAIPANTFNWIGPPLATFTAYGLQAPSAGPSSASVMCLSTLASALSSISFCPKAGTGAAIPTGPSSSTTTDLVSYTGTAGQQQDSGIASGSVATLAGSQTLTNKTMSGASNTISTYGTVVARITPLTAQAANVGPTTFLTLPAAAGYYQVCAEIVTTRAATSSSTQPQLQLVYTSAIDGVTKFNIFVFSNTFNETGNSASGCAPIFASASSVVQYQTQNYASTGATSMQYALMVWAISGNANGQ